MQSNFPVFWGWFWIICCGMQVSYIGADVQLQTNTEGRKEKKNLARNVWISSQNVIVNCCTFSINSTYEMLGFPWVQTLSRIWWCLCVSICSSSLWRNLSKNISLVDTLWIKSEDLWFVPGITILLLRDFGSLCFSFCAFSFHQLSPPLHRFSLMMSPYKMPCCTRGLSSCLKSAVIYFFQMLLLSGMICIVAFGSWQHSSSWDKSCIFCSASKQW